MRYIFKFVFLFIFCIAFAAKADLYTAQNVEMSGTGANPVQAKNNAITSGELKAFNQIIVALIGANNEAFVEHPSDDEILNMVRDISILEEKNTNTSYWGKMNVRFKEEAIQTLLKKNNQTYLKQSPPVYWLVPVWKQGTNEYTLEDENPFYQTLRGQNRLSDSFQIYLPNGDVNELIAVEKAIKDQDMSELESLASAQGAKRILVVSVTSASDGKWEMKPEAYSGSENIFYGLSVTGYGVNSLWEGWQRLTQKMAVRWQEKNTTDAVAGENYYARFNVNQVHEWNTLEKELKKLPFLENLTLKGAMPGQLLISFTYAGSTSELIQKLDKAGWLWISDTSTLGTLKRKDYYENTL